MSEFDQAQSPRLGQPTPVEATAVRMFAGTEIPEAAWRGQMIYRTDTQGLQVFNGTAWEDVVGGAAGLLTYVGPDAPGGSLSTGDLWFDSDAGYHLYRWDGSNWVSVQDASIAAAAADAASALATATAAQSDASDALAVAADAQATADGKVTSFFQATPPTGDAVGDLWFDTDDAYHLYRWDGLAWVDAADTRISDALSDAANAQATADGKIVSFYQTSPPTAEAVGDLWIDTDDGNKLYRWSGSAWVNVQDAAISAASTAAATANTAAANALTAAQAAQATADGAIRTYYQSGAPTGLNSTTDVGDMWFDTDDGQAYRWSGTSWVIIEDNSIAVALSAAQNAQTTADGKITAYYQTSAPTVGEVGDLWYDTDDKNKPYYCSSIGPVVWTPVRDLTIADAQTTANAKTTTFYQASAPTALSTGDIWYDTDDGNKTYRWSGSSWVAVVLGAPAVAPSDGIPPATSPIAIIQGGIRSLFVSWAPVSNRDQVTYEVHMSTTDGFTVSSATKLGDVRGGSYVIKTDTSGALLSYDTPYYVRVLAKDDDGPATAGASPQVIGTALQASGPDIASLSIIGDHIVGNEITADKFATTLAMASELLVGDNISLRPTNTSTDPSVNNSGIRIELTNGGYISFPADGSAAELIRVAAQMTELTVEDQLNILGINNRVGGALTLDSSIAPPSVAPTVTSVDDPGTVLTTTTTAYQGLGDNGTYFQRPYISNYVNTTGVATFQIDNINKTTGAATMAWQVNVDFYNVVLDNIHGGGGPAPTPVLASFHSTSTNAVFSIYSPAYTTWYYDDVTGNTIYTTTAAKYWILVVNNATGGVNYLGAWNGTVANYYYPAVFTNDTNIWVGASSKSDGHLNVFRYSMGMASQTTVLTTTAYTSRNMASLFTGQADYGAGQTRWMFTFGGTLPGASGIVIHNGTSFSTTENWQIPASEYANGLVYSSGRFYVGTNNGKIRKASTLTVTTSRAVRYAWRNTSSGAISLPSPTTTVNQLARKWLQVSTSPIPANSDVGAPNAIAIYVANSRQTFPAAGDINETYEAPTTGGAVVETVDGFAGMGFGQVVSEAQDASSNPLIEINGDGSFRLGPYYSTTSGQLPGGNLYKTGSQSANTTSAIINMDAVRTLRGGMTHYATTGMLIVPIDGWYQVSAHCMWGSSTSAARRILGIGYNSNGSSSAFTALDGTAIAFTQPAAAIVGQTASAAYWFSAGTYVGAWFNAGVAFGLDVTSSYHNGLSVVFLGG